MVLKVEAQVRRIRALRVAGSSATSGWCSAEPDFGFRPTLDQIHFIKRIRTVMRLKSNLQSQGSFIVMAIFRCWGFSNILGPYTTNCPMDVSSYFKRIKINSKSASKSDL